MNSEFTDPARSLDERSNLPTVGRSHAGFDPVVVPVDDAQPDPAAPAVEVTPTPVVAVDDAAPRPRPVFAF